MNTITIRQLIPNVFLNETSSHRNNRIWLTETTFKKGERYQINAQSGAGKSSLCSFIYGVRTDYTGEILFDNRPARTLTPKEWSAVRSTSLAYVPQNLELFPELTVMENIMLKNSLTGYFSPATIKQMLEKAGIAEKAETPVARLSVGQQQRVAIIRALCQPMDFLILDEPVSHLDGTNNAIMGEIIAGSLDESGAGLITTSVGNPLIINNVTDLTL